MKQQNRMLSNIAAVVGVSLMMVMLLLPAGLSGAGETDSDTAKGSIAEDLKDKLTFDPQTDKTLDPEKTLHTAPSIELTVETTTEESQTSDTQTTTTTPTQTTTTAQTTTVPQPAWTEQETSGTMYVNTDGIYSREVAVIGSKAMRQYTLNEAVTVVALTSTDYYKLADGTFIHSDYLSPSPVEESQPEETEAEESEPEEASISEEVPLASEPEIQAMALEMFRLVNEYREQHGLPAFQWDYNAYPAAQTRAGELLQRNSHTRPNGTRFSTVYDELGYSPGYAGENIVYSYQTASSALSALINSASHRELLLSGKFTHIAIAYVYDPNSYWGYYWVQELTRP